MFTMQSLQPNTIVSATRRQVSCDTCGETTVLQLDTGVYYGLELVSARIWSLLLEPQPIAGIRDAITAEYAVDPEQCEIDLLGFLRELLAEGLIEVQNGPVA